ncbi:hypothetical protein BD289DRAFT_425383 [Coniella lustricola]|uniref:Chitin-binding type-4 domain-containing protein n=1 Tax=Coniella lustricola TaxID=2025994 RepID=A0A2T3AHH9_9PEZI|nr:hypothetical protein BD289DRAFT_425383 [Coniella lustricola]
MASLFKTLAAVLAIGGSTASAHMILANPVPYGKDTITNSPLSSSGSNYPCQVSGDASTFYSTSGLSNNVTAGDSITMSFTGSAVHEGGSCQVALSTDMQPSQTTRWSVILSIEGGCPSKDGTSASTYDVTIPSDIPAGTYSYAWTWTSKLSGTQEYYMNCAPITVSAGSSKRDLRTRDDVMDSYPPLAVYNLADLNSCKSTLSSDPTYAFPGDNLVHDASGSNKYTPAAISGTDCFATGVTYTNSSSSDSSGSSSSSSSASSSESSSSAASSAAAATSAASSAETSAASATGGAGGGVFATSVTSAAAASVTSVDSGSTSASTTGSGSGSGASETTSASTSTSTGSASTSSSGSCTAGDYDCATDGSSYKMCVAGGTWSVSMSMAAGTACTPGTSSGLTISATSRRKWRFVRH